MTETELLLSYLDAQRAHVLGIVESLTDEQLRRPVLPSGWCCLGLIQHLALDVEQFWFRRIVAGEQTSATDDSAASAWDVAPGLSSEAVLANYSEQARRSDGVIAETSLDAAPAWWPGDLFGSWRLNSLREVMLHVITETACHAGHLDAARELIDGRTWLVLTE